MSLALSLASAVSVTEPKCSDDGVCSAIKVSDDETNQVGKQGKSWYNSYGNYAKLWRSRARTCTLRSSTTMARAQTITIGSGVVTTFISGD